MSYHLRTGDWDPRKSSAWKRNSSSLFTHYYKVLSFPSLWLVWGRDVLTTLVPHDRTEKLLTYFLCGRKGRWNTRGYWFTYKKVWGGGEWGACTETPLRASTWVWKPKICSWWVTDAAGCLVCMTADRAQETGKFLHFLSYMKGSSTPTIILTVPRSFHSSSHKFKSSEGDDGIENESLVTFGNFCTSLLWQ